MSKSQISVFLDFISAQYHEGKRWYVDYYVKNPATNELERKQISFNRIKSIKERRIQIRKLVVEINTKLKSGWNPFLENTAPKGFTKFSDALNTFQRQKLKKKSEDSVRSYKSFIRILSIWLEENGYTNIYAIQFTRAVARDFMLSVDDRINSSRTYNNYRSFFNDMFNWMIEFDYVKINPFDGLSKKTKEHKQRIQYIEDNVRLAIKEYLLKHDYNFYIACMFAFHVLVRPKEITLIKIKHIDIEKQQLHIPGRNAKNDKSRYPTIPNVMVPLLLNMHLEKYDQEMYLFTPPHTASLA